MAAGMEYTKVRTPGPRLATIRGVPVHLGRSWILITLLGVLVMAPRIANRQPGLGPLGAVVAALACVGVVLISALAHEAAHAVVAGASGCRVPRVVIHLMGLHEIYSYSAVRPMTMGLVALAGPAANILLAVLGVLALPFVAHGSIAGLLVLVLVFVNAAVGVISLVPGLPLDGGVLVQSLAWQLTGNRAKALTAMAWCGRVAAVVIVLVVLGLPLVNPALFDLLTVVWAAIMGLQLWTGANRADRIVEKARSMGGSSAGQPSPFQP